MFGNLVTKLVQQDPKVNPENVSMNPTNLRIQGHS